MTKKKTIEATILEIEQIAQKIEEDDISIDDVIKTYTEGIVLINGVKKEIATIINEIEQIDNK